MELSNCNPAFCVTCLSVDRKMIRLEELYKVYKKIIADDNILSADQMEVNALCWECHAYLCKIQKFQNRVRRAQELLNIKQNTVNSLSTLATNENPNIDVNQIGEYILKEEKVDIEDNEIYEHDGDNDMNVDNFNEHELKTDNTKDDSEVKGNKDRINSKVVNNLNFNLKDITFTKVVHESNGKERNFEEWKPNKNRKVKSAMKLKTKSTINVNQVNQYCDEKCNNALYQTDIDNLNVFVNNESIQRGIKYIKLIKNKRMNAKKNKKPKFRHLNNIDAIFDKGVKEKTSNSTEMDTQEKDVKRHLLILNSGTLYGCKVCGSYVKSNDREHHLKKHNKIMQCVTCELVFDGRRAFFRHYNEWHMKYICDKCGITFKMRLSIEKHIRINHSAVTCKDCGKTFPCHRNWRKHHLLMHQESPSYCVECDLRFANVHRYKRHLQNCVKHNPRPDVSIPCPDCDKVFTKRNNMKVHYAYVHLRQFNNRCEVCDKKYLTKSDLLRHIRHVHDRIQPTKDKICYICGKGFTTNRILSNHLHTHTGERPHACELCPARFTQAVALATHRRALHPEAGPMPRPQLYKNRQFRCELCSVKYTTAARLEKHKKDLHLVSKVSSLM